MNGCEGGTLSRVVQLLELALGSLADRTLLGSLSSLIDVTTNCANKFLLIFPVTIIRTGIVSDRLGKCYEDITFTGTIYNMQNKDGYNVLYINNVIVILLRRKKLLLPDIRYIFLYNRAARP